jgi:hypothetical protein
MAVERPPSTCQAAIALAGARTAYCSDIVLQGTETISARSGSSAGFGTVLPANSDRPRCFPYKGDVYGHPFPYLMEILTVTAAGMVFGGVQVNAKVPLELRILISTVEGTITTVPLLPATSGPTVPCGDGTMTVAAVLALYGTLNVHALVGVAAFVEAGLALLARKSSVETVPPMWGGAGPVGPMRSTTLAGITIFVAKAVMTILPPGATDDGEAALKLI